MSLSNDFFVKCYRVELLFVESGVIRGCGWQRVGAYINLGAFYLVGNPAAIALGFWANLGGRGMWIGILTGAFIQVFLLSIVMSRVNWNKQVLIFHFKFSRF